MFIIKAGAFLLINIICPKFGNELYWKRMSVSFVQLPQWGFFFLAQYPYIVVSIELELMQDIVPLHSGLKSPDIYNPETDGKVICSRLSKDKRFPSRIHVIFCA